jgi:hypothetical protein
MKQALPIVLVLAAAAFISTPAQATNEDLLRQATQACVFGAAVLGVSSAVVLYPAMVVGSSGVPATSLIIGNTLFGCGISALGAAAAGVYGQLYDQMFPSEAAVAPEMAVAPETSVVPETAVIPETSVVPETAVVPEIIAPAEPDAQNAAASSTP